MSQSTVRGASEEPEELSQKAVGVYSGGNRGSSGLRRRNQRLSSWLQMSHKTVWVASEQPEVAPGG